MLCVVVMGKGQVQYLYADIRKFAWVSMDIHVILIHLELQIATEMILVALCLTSAACGVISVYAGFLRDCKMNE